MKPEILLALLVPAIAVAQEKAPTRWITESTVTFGRGVAFRGNETFIATAVAVADIGRRWEHGRRTLGLSLLAGRDFPNEGTLVGLRGRVGWRWARQMLEGSLAFLASSAGTGDIGHADGWGASVGSAYYPAPPFALLIQVDWVPTFYEDPSSPADPTLARRAALSGGLRLAGRPGVVAWLGAALIGALALVVNP